MGSLHSAEDLVDHRGGAIVVVAADGLKQ